MINYLFLGTEKKIDDGEIVKSFVPIRALSVVQCTANIHQNNNHSIDRDVKKVLQCRSQHGSDTNDSTTNT